MKGYSTFLKAPGLEPHYQMDSIISRTLVAGEGGVYPFDRDAVGVFCDSTDKTYLCQVIFYIEK